MCLLQGVGDVVLVSQIFLAFFRHFRFFSGNETSFIRMELSAVARDHCKARFEYQAQQVVGILAQDTVCLCFGEGKSSGDFSYASHVIALIRVQRRKHRISGKSHWGEELYAIDLSLGRQHHHPIVQTISPLLR